MSVPQPPPHTLPGVTVGTTTPTTVKPEPITKPSADAFRALGEYGLQKTHYLPRQCLKAIDARKHFVSAVRV